MTGGSPSSSVSEKAASVSSEPRPESQHSQTWFRKNSGASERVEHGEQLVGAQEQLGHSSGTGTNHANWFGRPLVGDLRVHLEPARVLVDREHDALARLVDRRRRRLSRTSRRTRARSKVSRWIIRPPRARNMPDPAANRYGVQTGSARISAGSRSTRANAAGTSSRFSNRVSIHTGVPSAHG
jgi:hypothetical protein